MNGAESLFAPLPGSLPSGEATGEARAWTPPQGHADIAPTRYERIEGDGYLTLDAPWLVPALLRSAPIAGRVLEPAAGPFPDDGSPNSQARVEPAPRRLVGRSPAPSTDPKGRRQ